MEEPEKITLTYNKRCPLGIQILFNKVDELAEKRIKHLEERSPIYNNSNKRTKELVEREDHQVDNGQSKSVTQAPFDHTSLEVTFKQAPFDHTSLEVTFKQAPFDHTSLEVTFATDNSTKESKNIKQEPFDHTSLEVTFATDNLARNKKNQFVHEISYLEQVREIVKLICSEVAANELDHLKPSQLYQQRAEQTLLNTNNNGNYKSNLTTISKDENENKSVDNNDKADKSSNNEKSQDQSSEEENSSHELKRSFQKRTRKAPERLIYH
jgi:hypothetical protein